MYAVHFKNIIPKCDALSIWINFRNDSIICYIQIVISFGIAAILKYNWIGIRQWIPAKNELKLIDARTSLNK